MARRRRSNNPAGRPSAKLAEKTVLLSAPAVMLAAVEVAAEREGISVREWWRRAGRVRLGWREVIDAAP
ncbi:MAG: hypothetical protein ACYC1Z_14250 [Georgenia sp.]